MKTTTYLGGITKMKGKMKALLVFSLVALLALSGIATALPDVEYVKINGEEFETGDSLVVERGEELRLKVKLQAGSENYEDLEIEADIIGYEYNDRVELSDSTHTFDMEAGDTEFKTLSITMPRNAEKDFYDLRLRVAGRTGASAEHRYRIELEGSRNDLEIRDVLLHPSSVDAGTSALVTARLTNRGEQDEEDVKVTARINSLNVEDSYYITELEEDESKTSEELVLYIPACAAAGDYEVEVEVEFDEGYETVMATELLRVNEGVLCDKNDDVKSVVSVGAKTQQAVAGGSEATYSLAITNPSAEDRTYTVSVTGVDAWGTYKISPASTVLVAAKETKPVFVQVAADEDAKEGVHSFVVAASSGSENIQAQFSANVVEGDNLKVWAQYVLIALVVLLIILGLIIGFSRVKGRGSDEDDELSGQTYY